MGINADETLVVYQAMVGIQEIRHIKIPTFRYHLQLPSSFGETYKFVPKRHSPIRYDISK